MSGTTLVCFGADDGPATVGTGVVGTSTADGVLGVLVADIEASRSLAVVSADEDGAAALLASGDDAGGAGASATTCFFISLMLAPEKAPLCSSELSMTAD